jgi:chemotaxis protein MotB
MNARVPPVRVNHERWLVSYADFITLLFAFFVVLYAFARADDKKHVQVSQAINQAFKSMGGLSQTADASSGSSQDGSSSAPAEDQPQDLRAAPRTRADLERLRRELSKALAGEIAAHAISLEMGRDGLVISLREAGFFDSGSAAPKTGTLPALRQIATKLGSSPYDVRIEGHTDNIPIHNSEFASNWELSSARATNVARLVLDNRMISPERVSAAGYAEYHPIASNGDADGRAANRRVDLVVMPRIHLDDSSASDVRSSGGWQKVTDGE